MVERRDDVRDSESAAGQATDPPPRSGPEPAGPPAGYEAARESCAVVTRPPRAHLTLTGRDPSGMLGGIATGTVPEPSRERADGARTSRGYYSTILTPKGRMVTDLRILALADADPDFDPEADDPGYLLDLPRSALEGVQDHFRRFLPPRLARARDRSDGYGLVTVVGPEAAARVGRDGLGLPVGEEDLASLDEDDGLEVDLGEARVRIIRCGDVGPPAFDLLTDPDTAASLSERLSSVGVPAAGEEVWEVLRVEAGRPAYGPDMDDTVIPVEAGIQDRAIDYGKGCYTGQEVVVMIRDRGKVPRHLRGLLLGSQAPPETGTKLFVEGKERPVGEVRSAVRSPRYGQTAALGYVRREVEVPGTVRVGSPDGPPAEVRELTSDGWGAGSPDR